MPLDRYSGIYHVSLPYGPPEETKSVCLSTHIFTMQIMRVKSDPGFPVHASPQVSLTRSLLSRSAGRNQFSSAAQSCPTLCDPMDCSTPGLPVHHHLPEFAQTHVHGVGDVIQPPHPQSSPSPPTFNLALHQGLFQGISSSHQVAVSASASVLPMNIQN